MTFFSSVSSGSGCNPSAGAFFRALSAAALCALISGPARAQEASAWVEGPLSKVRLVAGALKGDVWQAGIEIVLKGEAHTYWRYPGEGGVPPTHDFAGSQNLKSAQVRYPAPKRMHEAGMDIFGYKGEVIFPLVITAADPAKPVTLALHFNYAACEKICMPAEARLKLQLNPRAGGNLQARISEYEARIPRPLDAPGAPAIRLVPASGGDKKTWQVEVSPTPDATADLFAVGPEGWFFDTRKASPGRFELILAEKPTDAGGKLPDITLTLTIGKDGFEGVRHLDADKPTP
jgi:DsbC/DsbD-like thiol-disulfide interchange protein